MPLPESRGLHQPLCGTWHVQHLVLQSGRHTNSQPKCTVRRDFVFGLMSDVGYNTTEILQCWVPEKAELTGLEMGGIVKAYT